MKTAYFILLGLLTVSTLASAQQNAGTWRHFHNTTTPRTMIADGSYLWIATDGGLVKFDRHADTVAALFTMDNSGLPADDVWTLALGKDGALWISTHSGGLARFQNNVWTYFNSSNCPLPGMNGGVIACDSLGRLWIGTTNGLLKFEKNTWTKYDSTNAPMCSNVIECFAADRQGNIWIGCQYHSAPRDRGFILKFDGDKKWEVHNDTLDGFWSGDTLYYEIMPEDPWCMMVDHTGALWIGFPDAINQQVPGKGWAFYDVTPDFQYGAPNYIKMLAEDTDGSVWGADDVNAVRIKGKVIEQHRWKRGVVNGFPFFGTCAVLPISGELWIAGNGGGGLARWKDSAWSIYSKFSDCPLESDMVERMTIDHNGHYWFGLRFSAGLYMYDGKAWTVYDSLADGIVLALAADSTGNLWIGTANGLAKFDGLHVTRFDLHAVDSFANAINGLMWDERHHALWVGNAWEGSTGYKAGIARFDGQTWKTWQSPDVAAQSQAFTLDTAGNVWATPFDAGVYEFDGETWRSFNKTNSILPTNLVFSPAADRKGGVWITLNDQGAGYWNGTAWQTYSGSGILSGLDACAIDTKSNVWFGAFPNSGIGGGASMFDGKTWTAFTPSNSKIGATMITDAMAGPNGEVWFGTNGQGLVEYVPATAPPASVTSYGDQVGRAMRLTCYPNPASTSAALCYSLPSRSSVTITLYDALGRIVARPVVGEMQSSGPHEVSFETKELPSGLYSCRLSAGGVEMFAKLIVARQS